MAAISEEFLKWIQQALKFGLEAYNSDGLVARIFIQQLSGEEHTIAICDNPEEFDEDDFLESARPMVAGLSDVLYYAIVWTNTITLPDDASVDAVLVEAGEREGSAVVMAQPFQRKKSGAVVAAGEIYEVSDAENYIDSDDADDEEREVSEEDAERLNQLVSAVISTGFQRLQAGNETPFACLAHEGEESFDITEPALEEGEFEDLVNSVREAVASNEDAQQYAIGYMGNAEADDGEIVQGLYVEAGNLNGQAPIYFVRYTVSEAGAIQPADEVELYQEGENLWVGDDGSNSDEDDEEETADSPLNELIPSVFSMAVDRLKEGIDRPCACLANSAEDPISILDPKPTDASNDELLDFLRGHIATLDEPQMYAIVYFAEMEVDGKDTDAIIVEAGERDGEASMFGLTYKVSKSGKVEHDEIEYLEAIDHLWQ